MPRTLHSIPASRATFSLRADPIFSLIYALLNEADDYSLSGRGIDYEEGY
jgi:hypothetical protein